MSAFLFEIYPIEGLKLLAVFSSMAKQTGELYQTCSCGETIIFMLRSFHFLLPLKPKVQEQVTAFILIA